VFGHVTADGLLPGPTLLAVLLAMSVLLSAPMLNRPATRTRLVAMLVGGQTFVHLVLTVTAGHRGESGSVAWGASARPRDLGTLPVVDGRRVGSFQDAYQGMSGHAAATPTLPIGHLVNDLSAHAQMMAAHLAAAALVGLWLAYGEKCLWTVLALTGRRVLALSVLLLPAPVPPRRVVRSFLDQFHAPVLLWQSLPRSRRGPPAFAS
jgi:hypothetical protein